MRIGQEVSRIPESFYERLGDRNTPKRPMVGRVVYIHPSGRYHIVEFALRGGRVRECFPGVQDERGTPSKPSD